MSKPLTPEELEYYRNNPNVQRYLNAIGLAEGTVKPNNDPYRVGFGGTQIEDLSDHPRQRKEFTQTDGKKNVTTAAGKYQFIAPTWDGLARQYGFKDFSPENQDRAAIALINEKGVLKDIAEGNYEPATKALGTVWASLPSSQYAQPKRSASYFEKALNSVVPSAQAAEPAAPELDWDSWTPSAPAQPAAVEPVAAPQEAQSAELDWDSWTPSAPAPQPAPEQPAPAAPQQEEGGFVEGAKNFGLGVARGARDLIDGPALWLAKGADKVAGAFGYETNEAQRVSDINKAAEAEYQAATPGSVAAGTGRVLGNVAGVVVPGAGVTSAASRATAALPKAAQAAARVGTNVAAGAAAGALDTRTLDESVAQNAAIGGLAGGVLGEAVNYIAKPLGRNVRDNAPEVITRNQEFGHNPSAAEIVRSTDNAPIANAAVDTADASTFNQAQRLSRSRAQADAARHINQTTGVGDVPTIKREQYTDVVDGKEVSKLADPYAPYNKSIEGEQIVLDQAETPVIRQAAENYSKQGEVPDHRISGMLSRVEDQFAGESVPNPAVSRAAARVEEIQQASQARIAALQDDLGRVEQEIAARTQAQRASNAVAVDPELQRLRAEQEQLIDGLRREVEEAQAHNANAAATMNRESRPKGDVPEQFRSQNERVSRTGGITEAGRGNQAVGARFETEAYGKNLETAIAEKGARLKQLRADATNGVPTTVTETVKEAAAPKALPKTASQLDQLKARLEAEQGVERQVSRTLSDSERAAEIQRLERELVGDYNDYNKWANQGSRNTGAVNRTYVDDTTPAIALNRARRAAEPARLQEWGSKAGLPKQDFDNYTSARQALADEVDALERQLEEVVAQSGRPRIGDIKAPKTTSQQDMAAIIRARKEGNPVPAAKAVRNAGNRYRIDKDPTAITADDIIAKWDEVGAKRSGLPKTVDANQEKAMRDRVAEAQRRLDTLDQEMAERIRGYETNPTKGVSADDAKLIDDVRAKISEAEQRAANDVAAAERARDNAPRTLSLPGTALKQDIHTQALQQAKLLEKATDPYEKEARSAVLTVLNRAISTNSTDEQRKLLKEAQEMTARIRIAEGLADKKITEQALIKATESPNAPDDLRRMAETLRDSKVLGGAGDVGSIIRGGLAHSAGAWLGGVPNGVLSAADLALHINNPKLTNMLVGNTATQRALERNQALAAALAGRAAAEGQRD